MSLINEALKRAEHDKRQAPLSAMDYPPLEPAEPSAGQQYVWMRSVVIGVAGCALAVAGWIWLAGKATNPAQAVASALQASPVPRSAVERTLDKTARATNFYRPAPAEAVAVPDYALAVQEGPQPSAAPAAAIIGKADPSPTNGQAVEEKPAPHVTFTLSAIMHGPDGSMAIINGQFVHAGEQVDGAKVVRINRHAAVLEVNGQPRTVTLQFRK